MDVERFLAARPDIPTIGAVEDGLPAFGEVDLLPRTGILNLGEIGRDHERRRRERIDRVLLCAVRGIARSDIGGSRHALMKPDPRGVVARRAHAAVHERERVEHLGEHFTCGYLRSRLTCEEVDVLGTGKLLREFADPRGRHAADSFGPFGRLRFTVVRAQHVILEVVFGRSALGHVLGVEPDAVRIEILLIEQIVLDLMIGHAQTERRIGAGTDSHPFVGHRLCGLVEPWIDDDDLAALLTSIIELVGGVAALVRHPVATEQDVQIAVGHAQGVGSRQHTARHEHLGERPRAERDGTQIVMHRATEEVEHTDDRIEVRVTDVVICRAQNGPVAVLVEGLLDLGRDIVERFLPANALPFVLAAHLAVRIIRAPALALHGILDARRRHHIADLGATARACTPLRHLDRVFILLVGADSQRNAILDVHPQQTARRSAAAVVHARAGLPFAGSFGPLLASSGFASG